MASPIAILERHAKRLYSAYRKERPRDAFGNVTPTWDALRPNDREIWRRVALAGLRSEETVADELKREERDRRASKEPA